MSLKVGTNDVTTPYTKMYVGDTVVWQAGNPAPAGTRALYHLNGDLVNAVNNTATSGTYVSTTGKFDLAQGARAVAFSNTSIGTFTSATATLEFWWYWTSAGAILYIQKNGTTSLELLMQTDNANSFDPSTSYARLTSKFIRTDTFTPVALLPSWSAGWHHFALTINQNVWHLYIDGINTSWRLFW